MSQKPIRKGQKQRRIIDTDIHERATYAELVPYLDNPWRRYITDNHWMQENICPIHSQRSPVLTGRML